MTREGFYFISIFCITLVYYVSKDIYKKHKYKKNKEREMQDRVAICKSITQWTKDNAYKANSLYGTPDAEWTDTIDGINISKTVLFYQKIGVLVILKGPRKERYVVKYEDILEIQTERVSGDHQSFIIKTSDISNPAFNIFTSAFSDYSRLSGLLNIVKNTKVTDEMLAARAALKL